MPKKDTNRPTRSSILNLISVFNSISKCIGFAVTKPHDTLFRKSLREIVFFWLLSLALYCTIRSELWCIKFLNMKFDIRKIIVFAVNQTIILSPFSCFLCFRLCDLPVRKIVLKIENLEKHLVVCSTFLEIRRARRIGLFFWFFQIFTVVVTMYCTLWPTMVFFIVDSICIFYFEVCVIIPCLQYTGWIWLLCHVSYRVRLKMVEINKLQYLSRLHFCRVETRLKRVTWSTYSFDKVKQVKRIIAVIKQVLNIAKELSAAYGITVLIYIVHYLSRIIIQFYDVIDKDAHKFPFWTAAWNVVVRIIFILPVFVCCEHLSYNINKTVELIREIVTLHQPSCLDCIFRSLTLRLKHQTTTTQICGFLNLTYGSFLTIMTTALAFLLLQLQFSK